MDGATVCVRDMRDYTGRLLATRTTAADGRATFDGLVAKEVGLFAVASGTGRAFLKVRLPTDRVVPVPLPPDRTVVFTVVHGETQTPVPDAQVVVAGPGTARFPWLTGCVPPMAPIRTNEAGQAVVSGLPEGYLSAIARTTGLASRGSGMRIEGAFVKPDDTEATIAVYPYRALRYPIQDSAAGTPADGTPLILTRYQATRGWDEGEPRARIEDGHLVIEPFPPGHDWGHATTPDGRWASWGGMVQAGSPISFVRAYDVVVRLSWRDGTPAANQWLSVRTSPRGSFAPRKTDAQGEVTFGPCIGTMAHVNWQSHAAGSGIKVADVNLQSDPGVVPCTIGRPQTVVVRTRIGGTPQLPTSYRLSVKDPTTTPASQRGVTSRDRTEHPALGEVHFLWPLEADGAIPEVTLTPEGMPAVTRTPQRQADGRWVVEADIVPSTTLRVRVVAPEGGRYWLTIERWHEDRQRYVWQHDHPAMAGGREAQDGVHTFRGLPQGRYRAVDRRSQLSTQPLVLTPEGETLDVTLDLSSALAVPGRVVAPAGHTPAFARVRVEERTAGSASTANPLRVSKDGAFTFYGVRGVATRLVLDHPYMHSDPAVVEVTPGETTPTFRLVPGPAVTFRLAGYEDYTTEEPGRHSPPYQGPVGVRVAKPRTPFAMRRRITPVARDGLFRLRVPAAGTWRVQVRRYGRRPWIFEDVVVGSGATDLGTLEARPTTTMTVRLLRGEKPIPPNVSVQATLKDEPDVTAGSHELVPGDPPSIVLKNLEFGIYRVRVQPLFSKDVLFETEIELDGSPRTLDARLP